jgi:hypothetical protein
MSYHACKAGHRLTPPTSQRLVFVEVAVVTQYNRVIQLNPSMRFQFSPTITFESQNQFGVETVAQQYGLTA